MNSAKIRTTLLVSVSLTALVLDAPLLAQTMPEVGATQISDQPAPTVAPPGSRLKPSSTNSGEGETIVVTGSRIRQPEFSSPDPVALIDPVTAIRAGKLDTAEMLQSSSIAAGSTQITSALSSNFVTNGGPGAATIDLRGLGPNRTLVLLNGRRAGPAGTRGGVSSFDLNVLPQSIVKRVDILKTGASSIYGSDAVAGVVNLITKTDTDGLELDGNVSVPTRSGGEQYRLSALWGKKFDRGHIMIAADYFHQNELARGDRKYLGCPEAYIFDSSGKRADLVDPRTGQYHCEDLRWGHVWTYDIGANNLYTTTGAYAGPVSLLQYQYPGENLNIPIIDPALGFSAPPGWFPTGYDAQSTAVQNAYHPFVNEQTLIPKTDRYTLYADAAFKLTDGVEAYAEFLGNRRKTYQNGWRQFWTFGYTGDLYGDGSVGTSWAQGFSGFNVISPTGITNHSDTSQKVDYWRGVGGLRGDLGGFMKGWSYDAYVQYSHNKGRYRTEQILQDVYNASLYQSGSCVGTTLPVSGKQCVDLPWTDPFFLAGQMTPAQVAYMTDWEEGVTKYTQLSTEASVSGHLFDLPAGPVGVALGATGRRDQIKDTPGYITLAGNAWGASTSGISAGYSITKEAFGELQVPLLKDKPFFRNLELSGAARVTNVKSVRQPDGLSDKDTGKWTYKIGANWAVSPWLRFRGTYGTSFRAPALFEQFKANETSFPNAARIDPCVQTALGLAQGSISQRIFDNCAAAGIPSNYGGGSVTPTVTSQGGIGALNPETSKAKTASVILTPSFAFLPRTRLSLAIDYFDIAVKGEVSQLGAATILRRCYDSPTFPTDPLCSLFIRGRPYDPYALDTINDRYINIASQRNKGLDFTFLASQNIGHLGNLRLLANVTYQLKDTFALFVGTGQSNNGDIGDPKFVGDVNLTWSAPGGWTAFWGTDIIGKSSNNRKFKEANGGSLCPQTSPIYGNYCVFLNTPTMFYHSASLTKEIGKKFEITLGVHNVFDTKPPRVTTIGGAGIPALIGPVVGTSQYDLLGRRLFLNIRRSL